MKNSDTWHWDMAMYLERLDITFYDRAGNLLATDNWANSAFHSFPDAQVIVQGLVNEMLNYFPQQTGVQKMGLQ